MKIFNINKKEKTKKLGFLKGAMTVIDDICPSYINNNNPKFLEIDEVYYGGFLVINYLREQRELLIKTLVETNINIVISLFYEKQNSNKIIRDLTYHIGNVSVDLENLPKNRQDIDIAAFTYQDAKYIRKEMQINNEEMYFFYLYVLTYGKSQKELEMNLNKIEDILQRRGMQTRKAYFREEGLFISCLPIMQNQKEVKEATKRNVLSSGLVSTYPFISSSIFDEEGIFIGTNIYNNSMVFIDRYCTEQYKNANMCVFGTSGAGKSFYVKLLILRYRLLGINQYVIDPDREYTNLCKKLNGILLKIGPGSDTYINIFDIRKESLEENEKGYLATKLAKLIGFFHLIFGTMDEEERAIIEEKLITLYAQKGITFQDKTLYKKKCSKVVFKDTYDMPILEDFYQLLGQDCKTQKFKTKLIPFIKGSMKFFNHYTNVELNNKLIVADIYELGEENLKYGMYIFTDLFWDKIKINRKEKKAIYLDEIWRLIGVTSNSQVASFIYKIFKTIRKYGGSSVAITQDISDLFSLEDGIYGKSILNNSSIKTFFSLEEENINILEKYTSLSEKEKLEIKTLKRGEALMFVGNEHIIVKIDCADYEKEIVTGEKSEEDINSNK